jgi:isoleucyl-tRNA synthetase
LTHGYVVDGEGRKMSKSEGNVIAPQELIGKFGSEIVRLWVSSVDYREDIRISDQILSRLVDAYRRIRNTCRFILGNLDGLTPQNLLPAEELSPLDRFALDAAARMHKRIQDAYASFEFHKVYHSLHNYCVTDLSAVYLDIIKDRLYAERADGPLRRSARTALWRILSFLLRDMAPVLSFTAEEIFDHIPAPLRGEAKTVFALPPLAASDFMRDAENRENWAGLLALRGVVTGAIEVLRRDGTVGHSLDTGVTLFLSPERERQIRDTGVDLRAFCIVSQARTAPIAEAPAAAFVDPEVEGAAVTAERALGAKCERCWIYSAELGSDAKHPGLCPRCAAVMRDCDGAA